MNMITKEFDGKAFVFRKDGYFNMTKAAKEFGRDLRDFMRRSETAEYVEYLVNSLKLKGGNLPHKEIDKWGRCSVDFVKSTGLIEVKRGSGQHDSTGTWAHPKLAVFFARWLDVKFAVWCANTIETILNEGENKPMISVNNYEYMFNGNKIRVVKDKEGTPWFVGTDITDTLGYGNSRKALRDHCKTTTQIRYLDGCNDSLRLDIKTNMIQERDIYRLVMRSRLPEAERFEEWVVGTVLPAVVKEGGYIMGEEKVATGEMTDDELILKAVNILNLKVERLKKENESLAKSNKEMSNELNILTVNEFIALSHRYMSHGQKVKIGRTASELCRIKGITIEKQDREIETKWEGNKQVQVNVYPREILEEALHLSEVLDYNKIAQVR